MRVKSIIWILVLFLLVSPVVGVGVRPAKTEFSYDVPGTASLRLSVINTERIEQEVKVRVSEQLRGILQPDEVSLALSADQKETDVYFTLENRALIPTGEYEGTIMVSQGVQSGAGIGTTVQLSHKVKIIVPEQTTSEPLVPLKDLYVLLGSLIVLITIGMLLLLEVLSRADIFKKRR